MTAAVKKISYLKTDECETLPGKCSFRFKADGIGSVYFVAFPKSANDTKKTFVNIKA